MAKFCETCKQSYPDDQPQCPHCAPLQAVDDDEVLDILRAEEAGEVVELHDEDAVAPAVEHTESSSAIDLGVSLAAEDAVGGPLPTSDSGTSNVAWASLVEDLDEEDARLKVDSPSDKDLIRHALPETGSEHDIEPILPTAPKAAGTPTTPMIGSNHDIDLGDEEVDLAASAVDLGQPASAHLSPPSDLRIVSERADDTESSAVDLGALAQAAAGVSESKLDAPQSSDVNLGAIPAGHAGSASALDFADLGGITEAEEGEAARSAEPVENTSLLDDLAQVEAGSAVDLGEPVAGSDRPSGRDLIAEAVESGVDLAADSSARLDRVKSEAEADDSAVDLASMFHGEGPSSVSSSSGIHGAAAASDVDVVGDVAELRAASGSDVDLDEEAALDAAAVGPDSGSSAVDLGGKRARAKGTTPPPDEPTSGVNLDEAAAEAAAQAEKETFDEEISAGEEPAVEEEEPAPRKAAKAEKPERPGNAKRWVGGGLVGAGAASLVWGGLVMSGILGGGSEPKRPGGPVAPPPPPPPVVAQADPKELLGLGHFQKAAEALKTAPDSAEVQAQRGAALWLGYLQEQMTKKAPLKADDPAVVEARTDLEKAIQENNPEAIFYLAQVEEWTKGAAAARKVYQDGLAKSQNDPVWKRRFQAALDRLDTQANAGAGVGQLRPGDAPDAAAQALVTLLVALQAPQPGAEAPPAGGAAPADDDEAGYAFWNAVKLARSGKYAEAVRALDAARKVHAEKRFARLHKAQNPHSDPTEEIFLRSCDELKAYWVMQESLAGAGLARGANPADAVKQLRQEAEKAKEAQALAVKAQQEAEAARGEAKKLMTQVADVQKDAEQARKQAMALDEKLKMTDAQRQAAETKVKGVGERLEAAGIKSDDPVKGVDQLAAARNDLKGTIDQAAKKLAEAHLLPAGESAALLRGIEQAIKVAQASDPKGDLKKSQMEVANLKTALEQRRSPEEMLDVWLPVLAVRVPREAADRALADAAFVLSSRPEAAKAAKAQAVRGLALRATGDYDGARKALDQAVKQGAPASASQALKALSDPNAFYAPRAHELMTAGRHAEAVELLTEAVAVFPKNNAGLLALRSLARLEGARVKGGGKVTADDPAIAEAKRDAQAAAAAGAHEGHYAVGRIAELLGNVKEAQDGYRRCLAAHPVKDDVGSRYRIALARVLLKSSSDRAAALPTDGAVAEAQPALASLVLLMQLTAQAGAGAAADEAARLADEVLESKEASFLARAQALGMKGLWTKALQTYADGLRSAGRPDHADVLAEIIDKHPGLKRTESQAVANPLQAEGYYAQGQRAYWARRYADAEKAFAAAVEADGQDARYHYFLGLARLGQGKRQAYEDFEEGARLERLERPGRAAVSAALERLQGSARQTVNSFRP